MKPTNFDSLKWYKEALQSQLKPCPFCGEKKNLAIHVPNNGGKEDITCLGCGAKMEKALGEIIK
jgi:transcription elongation factor Elf1